MLSIFKEMILENKLCVLCTCSDNLPDASLMLYICDDSCTKLYMLTLMDTKKHYNICNNSNVNLLVDNREKASNANVQIIALTINGKASVINDKTESSKLKDLLLKKHDTLLGLASSDDVCVIEISITDFLLLDSVDTKHYVSLSGK